MDSRPQLEGRALLRRLLSQGIACTYVLLNAASYIMSEVTKVCSHCYAFAWPVIQHIVCLPSKHPAAGVTGVLFGHLLDVTCNKGMMVAA